MKESKLQTELVKSAQYVKGIGIKINPAWTKGVSDLYLAIDGVAAWIECKVEKKQLKSSEGVVINKDPSIGIDMTPMQRHRLKMFRETGIVAGWLVAYRMNGEWYAVFGVDSRAARVVPTHSANIIGRMKGGEWDVKWLVDRLAALHVGTAIPDEYELVK